MSITGSIVTSALSNMDGYLLCDGSAISRSTYAELFSVIGTIYGSGDGSTTFNLPDLRGRSIFGRDSTVTKFDTIGKSGGSKEVTLTVDEMPSHSHSVSTSHSGSTSVTRYLHFTTATAGATVDTLDVGNNQPHTNMSPFIVLNYFIKE